MKLSEYAKQVGVTWKTANKWFHNGQIPGAYQLPTGTIIVPDEIFKSKQDDSRKKTIIYARVSSSEQRKTNLEYQAKRLTDFATANGWVIDQVIKEVGSGLNDHRPKLEKLLLETDNIERIIVEHKDRLTRFGFNYLEILAKKQKFEIIVVNKTENDSEDLLEDLTSIITSFCARIYGQRRGKRKTEKITEELKNNDSIS